MSSNIGAYNCVVILGATATGKTSVGVAVASAFNGEIISADSRQTYRHLDIGSGKDLDEYEVDGKKIPYHLIDIIDLPAEYNAPSAAASALSTDIWTAWKSALAILTCRWAPPG